MHEKLTGKEHENIKRFSQIQREKLEKSGYCIFELHGESMLSLRKKGISFWSKWHEGEKLEADLSRRTEVAINPKNDFLENSGNKSVFEQLKLVNKHRESVLNTFPGVNLIIGRVADYLELDLNMINTRGFGMFRNEGNGDLAVTTSLNSDGYPVFVGRSYSESMIVSYRMNHSGGSDIKVIPLIVPQE